MTSEDLTALARTAVRAIVELIGSAEIVATARKAEPGLLTRTAEFHAGKEDKAIPAFAKAVQMYGIRRFMVQSAPVIEGSPIAVVTEDGVSVRASSYVDTQDQEWVRLSAWGLGAKA